jgi:hypothetical protein
VRVEAEGLARVVSGVPPIRIARVDVAAVEERAAGVVVRDRSGRSLLVPREIEGYERALGLLQAWRQAQA